MTEATEDAEILDASKHGELETRIAQAVYQIIPFKSVELPREYHALVFSCWLRSLRFGNPMFKKIDSDAFYKEYHQYLENLLSKPDSITRLAIIPADSDGPEVVLGFSVSREDVLDYVHVQKDGRRKGIAKALIPFKVNVITHITLTALDICKNALNSGVLKFNPFA